MQDVAKLFVVDVETTGANPVAHDPLAIALVPLLRDSAAPFVANIVTRSPVWTDFASENFKNFREEWAATARPPHEVLDSLESYIATLLPGQEATLIGHNVGFDIAFLRKLAFLAGRTEIMGVSHRAIDTHTLLYLAVLNGKLPEKALPSDGAFEYFQILIPEGRRHTALHDALATRELFLRLMEVFAIEFSQLTRLAEHPPEYEVRGRNRKR